MLALYVVAGHARWLLWQGHAAWLKSSHPWWENVLAYASAMFRFGHEAVMVFFVLSGFFIHLRSARQSAQGRCMEALPVRTYALRRAHRLLPAYGLALIVTVLLDAVGRHFWPPLYLAASGDAHLDQVFAKSGYSSSAVLPALMALPSSTGWHFGTNGPLWSLAYEVIFYLLYPAWLWLRRRGPLLAFGVIPGSGLLLAYLGAPGFAGSVWVHYGVWLAGAALAEFLTRKERPGVHRGLALVVSIAGFTTHLLTGSSVLHIMGHMAYGTGIVLMAASVPSVWSGWRPVRALEWLGMRSYSLYITHFPCLVLLSAWLFQVHGGRPASGWMALAGLVSAVGFGCLCFELCEKHFLHARLKLSGPASA
jgi:peptidoglycan/LPS O-acetylase OafA/YrhL